MSDVVSNMFLLSPTCYLFITGVLLVLLGASSDVLPPKIRINNNVHWLVPALMFYGLARMVGAFNLVEPIEWGMIVDSLLKLFSSLCALEFIRRSLNEKLQCQLSVFLHVPVVVIISIINSFTDKNVLFFTILLYALVKLTVIYVIWRYLVVKDKKSQNFVSFMLVLAIFVAILQVLLFLSVKEVSFFNISFSWKIFKYLAFAEFSVLIICIFYILFQRYKYDKENQTTYSDYFKLFIPSLICVLIISFSVFGIRMSNKMFAQDEQTIGGIVETASSNLARTMNERIEFVSTSASIISNIPAVCNYFEEPTSENLDWVNRFLVTFNSQNPDTLCFLLDENGIAKAASHKEDVIVGYNFAFRRYFKRARAGYTDISLGTGLFTRIIGFYASSTIRSLKDGRVLGVAVVKRNIEDASRVFKDFFPAMMLDYSGNILMSGNDRFVGVSIPGIGTEKIAPTKITKAIYEKLQGFNTNYWYATEPLKGDKWQIMVLRSAENGNYQYWLLLVILLLVGILIAIMRGTARNNEYLYDYEAAQKQFKLLFDYAPDSVFVVSAKTFKIIEANHQMALVFGATAPLTGTNYFDLLAEKDGQDALNTDAVVGVFRQECKYKKNNGEEFVAEVTGSKVVFNGEDSWMIILHDITAHKNLENQLREANLLKGRFFANASHEIRTPMTAIIGLTELAVSLCNNDGQRHIVELIRTSAKSMLNLINDILDMAKIEAGKFIVKPVLFNLHLLLNDLSEILRYRAEFSVEKIELEISSKVPEMIVSDPDRIRRLLINLLDNTLNTNDNARIKLSVYVSDYDEDRDSFNLVFYVTDREKYLNEEEQQRFFDAFVYTDPYVKDNQKTEGLGLSITKQIIDLMGGDIGIKSDEENGTSFIVTVPVKRSEECVSQYDKDELLAVRLVKDGRPLKFLIADDNEINLFVANSIIEKFKGITVCAKDGEEVLDIIKKEEHSHFDCLLLDIQMPRLDGISTIKKIRGMTDEIKDVPIIAISAFASEQEGELVKKAGASGYLSKPYFPEDLIAILQEHLGLLADSRVPLEALSVPVLPRVQETINAEKEVSRSKEMKTSHIDRKELELRLLRRPEDIVKICEIYKRRYESLLNNIDESIEKFDSASMREVAHSIRGLADMLSAKAVADIARLAEGLAKEGKDSEAAERLANLKGMLTEIDRDLETLKKELES
ncbi:MAG: response regulator [Candidatus Riflebacteria bacterium]|nr:response regulator [Candidatus Riflebacteria bacterium]